MSTTTTVAFLDREKAPASIGRRLVDRLIEARLRQAERAVGQVLNRLPDERLLHLGLTRAEISELRAIGRLVRRASST